MPGTNNQENLIGTEITPGTFRALEGKKTKTIHRGAYGSFNLLKFHLYENGLIIKEYQLGTSKPIQYVVVHEVEEEFEDGGVRELDGYFEGTKLAFVDYLRPHAIVKKGFKLAFISGAKISKYKGDLSVKKTPTVENKSKGSVNGSKEAGNPNKGTGNNRQIDFTRGFDIDPKYSSYEQRVKTTPVSKGEWSNERAESLFISDKTGEIKKYLDEAGVDGVEYKNGMPDFSPFSKGEIKLENMTNDRKSNFSTADEELAKKWSTPEQKWTAEDLADWREDNKYTWHELNDLETIQLVPSKINSVFKHLGGVGEYNIKVKLGE